MPSGASSSSSSRLSSRRVASIPSFVSSPRHALPPLLLAGAAAACGARGPRVGIEAVLAQSGLSEALLEPAKRALSGSIIIVADEAAPLMERFRRGELDLLLANGDLPSDALLREGVAGSADPLCHHEMVLVGPANDPAGVHAERRFENVLRTLVAGDVAFFRCSACGARAREDAIFSEARDLPRRGSSFVDVGKSESDVVKAMESAPGYALLSRPTVLRLMKAKEWSFKPLWSGDARQVDTYRLIARPIERMEEPKRGQVLSLLRWLRGEEARAIIGRFGTDSVGQPLFRPGAAPPGQGFRMEAAAEE